jgi:hypothetical protein
MSKVWIAILPILLLALASDVVAQPSTTSGPLKELAASLEAVRAIKPVNKERDAGPELTRVKRALRSWIETQLPPPTIPGRIQGTIETPDRESLAILAAHLNDALDKAGLACGDFNSPNYRCAASESDLESERGSVGSVQLGTLYSGGTQYLLVVSGVGVLCGQDESAYLYAPQGNAWKLVFAREEDDYRANVYAPQNITEIAISDEWTDTKEPRPPLIATLGFGPWCSSTWSSIFTRLWRVSGGTTTPDPLLSRTDGLWWGGDDFGSAQLSPKDLLVQYVDASMDSGEHSRMHVRNYRVGVGDKLERIDPFALRPMDFVDEWLTTDWGEASRWIEDGGNRAIFRSSHRRGKAEFDDAGKRCRADRSLWQVALVGGRYFKVRWSAPYVFRLVAVSDRPFAGCDLDDPKGTDQATLFPETQWHPHG